MLSVRDISLALSRRFRLDAVSLDVAPGETLSILGPNGSGKSSLLRLIAGLERPEKGTITLDGATLSEPKKVVVPPDRRRMSLLLQDGALFPHLGVRGNVALGLPPGTPKDQRHEAVERALELARVEGLVGREIATLSGGEQQRVALARALVAHPAVLLLDEPFQGLDRPTARRIIEDLREIIASRAIAAVHVTHDAEEAAALSDRVAILVGGRLVQRGTFGEVYDAPADAEIAALLGPVETLPVDVARRAGLGLPSALQGEELAFRPEHLIIRPATDDRRDGPRVTRLRSLGPIREVTLTLDDEHRVAARCPLDLRLEEGDFVEARLDKVLAPASKQGSSS